MKYLILILSCIFLFCSPCRQCTSYIVDGPQVERWRDNGVRIVHIDTLDNNFYEVYVK